MPRLGSVAPTTINLLFFLLLTKKCCCFCKSSRIKRIHASFPLHATHSKTWHHRPKFNSLSCSVAIYRILVHQSHWALLAYSIAATPSGFEKSPYTNPVWLWCFKGWSALLSKINPTTVGLVNFYSYREIALCILRIYPWVSNKSSYRCAPRFNPIPLNNFVTSINRL